MPLPRFDPIAEINVKRTVKRTIKEEEEGISKNIPKIYQEKLQVYIYTRNERNCRIIEQFALDETRFILD